jgi:hypothetical protein
MQSTRAIVLVMMTGALLAFPCDGAESDKPASQPADPPAVQWRFYSDFADGRRFLTDGSLVLDAHYIPGEPVPQRSLPPESVQRLLRADTDHEFGLSDLLSTGGPNDHYRGPGPVVLNRKYVDLLRGLTFKDALRFRAKGGGDRVLLVDGGQVIGVVMPVKQ